MSGDVEGLADFGPREIPPRPADVDERGMKSVTALRADLRNGTLKRPVPIDGHNETSGARSSLSAQTTGQSEDVTAQ